MANGWAQLGIDVANIGGKLVPINERALDDQYLPIFAANVSRVNWFLM